MKLQQVDIIIISFNQEYYIDQTISSVLNQTYTNTRIIISDDGSTDGTRKIIEKWQKKYSDKITAIYNPANLGITGNSNTALRKSIGDYFLIIGGDDILYPQRVEAQVEWFKSNPGAVLCGSEIDYIDANSSIIKKYKPTKKKSGKGNINWITGGMLYATISIMYKRSYKSFLEYDQRLSQVSDLKFCIDFLGDNGVFGFLDLHLSGYRKTNQSYTVSQWQKSLEDCNLMFETLKKDEPDLLPQIKKGQNYLVNYSRGMMYLKESSFTNAIQSFLNVIKIEPINFKAIFRIIQVLVKLISS